MRGDVVPYDLLRAVGNLSRAGGDAGAAYAGRMLELLVDGMRFSAARPKGCGVHSGSVIHRPQT